MNVDWRNLWSRIVHTLSELTRPLFRSTIADGFEERNFTAGRETDFGPLETNDSLSPLQQGLLLDSLRMSLPGVNVEQVLFELNEKLNITVFEKAWRCVLERHSILRASFHWDGGGEPRQVIPRQVLVTCRLYDWRSLSARECQQRREEFLRADRQRGFDLTAAPLMRLAIIRGRGQLTRCCWTLHHLLADARAYVLILQEVFTLYEAFQRGEEMELPPPAPFRNHLGWLRQQDWSRSESFWRQTLQGFQAPTPLTVERTSPQNLPSDECRGEQTDRLSSPATDALRAFAKTYNVTLNTLFQAAWALLLSRYSGESDVVFGAVRAGRRSSVPDADQMVGPFINTVPVRVHVDPERPLLAWLQEVRAQWVAVRDHEHTPLVKVQGWSDVPRGTPLLESLVNFQDPSWDEALRSLGGRWQHRQFGLLSQPNFPLALDGYAGTELRLKIIYDRRRFDDDMMSRLLGHLRTSLEGMAACPEQTVGMVPLLTAVERRQLLVDWNDTQTKYPREKCIHELFEAQVRRSPRAVAVVFGTVTLTYDELNRSANRLANYLRTRGVQRGTRVALCVERSAEMVVALLGILKSGGAYVPLDPDYPGERLVFMLHDAQASVLLTQQRLRGRIPETRADVILLDGEPPVWATVNDANTHSGARASDAAYVIYTSGSTGQPKGTVVPQRAVNRLVLHTDYIALGPKDRVAQASNASFDAATFEIWGALLNGARLVGISRDEALSPTALAARIREHDISTLFVTTALFNRLTQESPGLFRGVRTVLFGGEQVDPKWVREALRHGPPERLLHVYGPTETTTFATWYHVQAVSEDDATVPIGRPIANTQLYVLDKRGEPVPIGVPGELHIGGDGLAEGYLGRPDLTSEKFVPNPFHDEPSTRLYRTGDRVRYLPDGNIEFLGRTDQQVKIRGFRIELGEIESVLAQHPDIREAVVMAREDEPGQRRLVAYLTPQANLGRPIRQPLSFLKPKLPDYMIPSLVVELESLPLTPNGKVDRRALPKPDRTAGDAATGFSAPRTLTEEVIVSIWEGVLHLEQVHVEDQFFNLGGDSLSAMQATIRMNRAFTIDLPVGALFEHSTVAALSAHIDTFRRTAHHSSFPEFVSVSRDAPLPISIEQNRMWHGYQNAVGDQALAFVFPVRFQVKGPLDVGALGRGLNELVRRHEILRTTYRRTETGVMQIIGRAEAVDLPVTHLANSPGRTIEAARLAREEYARPFDLATGPVLRAKLLSWGDSDHQLLLTLHHIAYDPRALTILLQELGVLYGAFCRGEPSPLADPAFHYADYTAWQQRWLRANVAAYQHQLTYWRKQLGGNPTVPIELFRRPQVAPSQLKESSQLKHLPQRLFIPLKALARRECATPFLCTLAAILVLLQEDSNADDLLVATLLGSRCREETENVVGYLGNVVAIRAVRDVNLTFREWLDRVRKTMLDAAASQELPFESIQQALQQEGQPPPVPQMGIVGLNLDWCVLSLAGLKTRLMFFRAGFIPHGLCLGLSERLGHAWAFANLDSTVFDPEAVQAFLSRLITLLEQVVANPDQRLSELVAPRAARRAA